MSEPIVISNVKFTTASREDSAYGLLGYLACTVNSALRLDGLTLRRTADGRFAVSWPARRDGFGRQRFYVRPIEDRARREIEQQIFRALRIAEEATR